MFELRFGSYSSRSTFAAMPSLLRRKPTTRQCCLWPPPLCRVGMWPLLLRPVPRLWLPTSDAPGGASDTTGASSTVIRRSLLYLTAFILGLLGPHYLCNGPRVGLRQSRGDARFAPWLCPPRSCQQLLKLRDGCLRQQHVLKAHERHRI